MTISFTGIQNVAAIALKSNNYTSDKLVLQLTDLGEKDLTKFQDVFQRFPDPEKKGYLRLESEINQEGIQSFRINDEKVPIKEGNLRLFTKVATLLRRITQNEQGFEISPGYKTSNDCSLNLFDKDFYKLDFSEQDSIDKAHEVNETRESAYYLNKILQMRMADYFNIDYLKVKLNDFQLVNNN